MTPPNVAAGAISRARRPAIAVFAAAVFVLAAAPRLADIDAHLTPDEMRWVCRTLNFHAAVRAGDWAGTVQTGHPGVVTMWLGGLGLPVEPAAPWAVACRAARSSEPIYALEPADRAVLLERLYAGRRRVASRCLLRSAWRRPRSSSAGCSVTWRWRSRRRSSRSIRFFWPIRASSTSTPC